MFKTVDEVLDQFADVVVSNHVLEHVDCPLEALRLLRPKIQPGGLVVFVVPHQTASEPYRLADINQHLYTWNPMTLGNLLTAAGYCNVHVDVIRHTWIPQYARIYNLVGERAFHLLCRAYAIVRRDYQIRAVGINPERQA